MSPEASPIQQAFNLTVFGPLGIALAAKAALPEWIEKGRVRAVEQFAMAKAVGETVTDYGQQKVAEKLVGLGILPGPQPPAPSPSPAAEAEPPTVVSEQEPASSPSPAAGAEPLSAVAEPVPSPSLSPAVVAEPATNGRSSPAASGDRGRARSGSPGPVASGASPASSSPASLPAPVVPAAAAGPVVDRDDLAIPGYDSLSASQVVSRLAGLAPDELESVRAYEAASRGRRTILTKISQLQTGRL